MCSRETLLSRYQYVLNLLLIPIIFAFIVTGCGDDVTSPNKKLEDPRGTIQGEVFDKASGNSLSGVQVTVVDSTGAEDAEWTASTNENGVFTIDNIPVTADAKSKSEGYYSNPYTLHLDASSLENYRESYKAEMDVVFETSGGDGAVSTDIVSKVKLPLSKQAVKVTGKAQTTNGKNISGATVELYQYYNPVINGSSDTETKMLLATAETSEDGSFAFDQVEEDADIYLKFTDESDPANVVSGRYPNYSSETTPSGSEENATLDLGVVEVSLSNESGAFYVTDVMPSPEANIGENQEFMYIFNRPVAENPYTDASASFGVGTMKDDIAFEYDGEKSFKSPGDVEFSVSWGDTRDTLIIEPEVSTMQDGSEYELQVDAFDDDRFVDEHDNMIGWNVSEYQESNVEDLTFFTNFNTTAPHTPKIAVDSAGLNTDWNSGSHTIEWSMNNNSAAVKEYEVYISRDGGAYQHLATKPAEQANFGDLDYDLMAESNPNSTDDNSDQPDWFDSSSFSAEILTANQDDNPIDKAHSHKVKVRAVSENLVEGAFSDPITFEDVTKPGIMAGTETDNADIYVSVDEPLDKGTAEDTDNYTITDNTNGDLSVSSVSYDRNDQDNPNGNNGFDIIITVSDANNLTSGNIEISSDVTDLTGNNFDTNDNTTSY